MLTDFANTIACNELLLAFASKRSTVIWILYTVLLVLLFLSENSCFHGMFLKTICFEFDIKIVASCVRF